MRDLNKRWTDDAGRAFQCQGDTFSANVDTAVQDLIDNHPLIIGALGHATVLTAITSEVDTATSQYEIQEVIVRDPMPGRGGRRQLTPMEWRSINFAARIRITDAKRRSDKTERRPMCWARRRRSMRMARRST